MNHIIKDPPRWPKQLLEWYCGKNIAEDIIGDVEEIYWLNLEQFSTQKAKLKYTAQCLTLLFSYAVSSRKRKSSKMSTNNNISMFNNYFKVAFRSLSKNKFFTVINVIGLAVGMSIGLLAVAALVDILTIDNFHSKNERIYRVISQSSVYLKDDVDSKWASVPEPLAYEIKQGFQGVEKVVRFNKSISGLVDNNVEKIPIMGYYTDPEFFNVFGYKLESGNPETALKDPYSVVITYKAAEKFFHGLDPIGKDLVLDGQGTFKVTGVLAPSPRSHFLFEILGSYSTLSSLIESDELNDWENLRSSYAYLLLDKPESMETVNSNLNEIPGRIYSEDKLNYASFSLQSISDIPMSSNMNNEVGIVLGWPIMVLFFVISFLILTPACFNYASLSISKSIMRSKEIGLRKVVGSSKAQILWQFLIESMIITLVALIGAVLLFVAARTEFQQMIVNGRETFDFELDFLTVLGFIFFGLLTGTLAGLAPAIYFSKLNPLQTLRAAKEPSKMKRTSLKKVLTIGQFSLSLFFIMGVGIIMKQYKYALNFNYGFEQENILDVKLNGVDPSRLKTELERLPEVKMISFSSHIPGTHESRSAYVLLPEVRDSIIVSQMFIDENFIANLNLDILSGSNFSEDAGTIRSSIIVNERFLKQFQIDNPLDAINTEFIIGGKNLTIIGVIKDFNHQALRQDIEPFFFSYDTGKYGYVNLNIAGSDILTSLEKIENAWNQVSEERKFEAKFLSDEVEEAMISFKNIFKIFGSLGFLSIVISCLGLLGMVVFTVENKMKEVGVRKAMGASVAQLVYSLSVDFIKFLVYAAIITTPIAYFFFEKVFLRMQHFRANVGLTEISLSILLLVFIGLVTILSQTRKAAYANPADILRYE